MNQIPDTKTCRGKSCGRPIRFIVAQKTKKRIPVDADLVTVTLGSPLMGKMLVLANGTVVKEAKIGASGYTPHWVTCPDAGAFKKGARRPQ